MGVSLLCAGGPMLLVALAARLLGAAIVLVVPRRGVAGAAMQGISAALLALLISDLWEWTRGALVDRSAVRTPRALAAGACTLAVPALLAVCGVVLQPVSWLVREQLPAAAAWALVGVPGVGPAERAPSTRALLAGCRAGVAWSLGVRLLFVGHHAWAVVAGVPLLGPRLASLDLSAVVLTLLALAACRRGVLARVWLVLVVAVLGVLTRWTLGVL